ncbi:MAG: TetR/AcrR family transcriptional regulator [Gammaproteobacteria bacterium]|jgi:AcrR family transcriptional regulator|nr:TetR/AcrR family transcriptional regulator [Gammaproteobacteria bacterium]MBT7369280.1 TetR/AcrR family transcriptional regulator [Gammaproteobacteria bacterium]
MQKVKSLTPKQEDRRHRILSAARDMVADHGYEGMVMSQVADRAGVSPTTLYNLFNTKDQLVMESLRELMAESAREVIAGSDGPGWRYLYETQKSGAAMVVRSPAYADAMLVALQRAKAGDDLVTVLIEIAARDLQVSMDAMAERGELREGVNTRELAIAVNGVYWSSFILWNKGVINLLQLEHAVLMNFLSLLIPSTVGETRAELEATLADLG